MKESYNKSTCSSDDFYNELKLYINKKLFEDNLISEAMYLFAKDVLENTPMTEAYV